DRRNAGLITANPPVVGGAKQLAGDGADHREVLTSDLMVYQYLVGCLAGRVLPALRKCGSFRAG
ncbi:MAG: hypothetical protein ACM3W7_00710, partial [Acidobacteriota bacterium]